MNKSFIVAVALVGAILGGLVGWFAHVEPKQVSLGAVANYSNSGGSSNLYSVLASLLTDITSVRGQFLSGTAGSGLNTTTSAPFGFVTLGPDGSTTSTASTTITIAPGLLSTNDKILLGESTTTVGILYLPTILTSTTIQILAKNLTASNAVPATTTFSIYDVTAGFAAPPALTTTSSTSN